MAMKSFSPLLRASEMEPYYEMQFSIIPRSHLEGSYPSVGVELVYSTAPGAEINKIKNFQKINDFN